MARSREVLAPAVWEAEIANAIWGFDVVIDHVDIVFVQGQSHFDMGTIAVSVVVRLAPNPTP